MRKLTTKLFSLHICIIRGCAVSQIAGQGRAQSVCHGEVGRWGGGYEGTQTFPVRGYVKAALSSRDV